MDIDDNSVDMDDSELDDTSADSGVDTFYDVDNNLDLSSAFEDTDITEDDLTETEVEDQTEQISESLRNNFDFSTVFEDTDITEGDLTETEVEDQTEQTSESLRNDFDFSTVFEDTDITEDDLTETEIEDQTEQAPEKFQDDFDLSTVFEDTDVVEDDLTETEEQKDIEETEPSDLVEESQDQDRSHKERIDGHTYYFDSNGDLYRVDSTLMSSASYELNGYHFQTDDFGRIETVRGILHLRDRDRMAITDKIEDIGWGYELETDDRGHIIGDRFDGPNRLENLIPQDFSINRGEYNSFEKELADAVSDKKEVYLQVELAYPDDSFRPEELVATYTIDGETFERHFPNQKDE